MRTPEDEAFDELARRQGGGGFKAKQAMAADKMQEPVCDKDPQGCWNVRCQLGKQCKNLAQPAQELVATVTATVTSETGNPDVTMSWWHEPPLPVGTPLYTYPPKRPWVGLTDADIADCMEMSIQKTCRAVEQLLKDKNS